MQDISFLTNTALYSFMSMETTGPLPIKSPINSHLTLREGHPTACHSAPQAAGERQDLGSWSTSYDRLRLQS